MGAEREKNSRLKLQPAEMDRTEYSIMLRITGLKTKYNYLNAAKYGQTIWFYILKPKGSETSGYKAYSSVKIVSLKCITKREIMFCYVLHDLKTEDVFAETELSLQSHFSALKHFITM